MEELEHASSIELKDPEEALKLYYSITNQSVTADDEAKIKEVELALSSMGKLLAKQNKAKELANLIKSIRPFLGIVSKAKASKIVRELVDTFLDMGSKTGLEIPLCLECIEWAKSEKRTFLTQALEARLILLYHSNGDYTQALNTVNRVMKELKKMDDKQLLMEVQLSESKVYHTLGNVPKARAALTSARTTANSIYVPPKLQSALDMQSGILHGEEKDFKTAFSYFYEAFEGYDSVEHPFALDGLKYMLLSKIMLGAPDDVQSLLTGKMGLKYSGRGIDAMKAIADAGKKRDISIFNETIAEYDDELKKDPVVQNHLKALYDNLLEKNLVRIIEPYSRVQIAHVAETISLPYDIVEKKLSQIILDKKFSGILDQGSGVLIVYDGSESDQTYTYALDTITHMGKVVDVLFKKAQKLS
ncbi:hypothetical protein ACHWQZ_G008452 [Mnemiopsis leidyi]